MRKIILTLAACALGQQASATVIYSQNFDAAGIGSTIAGWTYEAGNIWQVTSDATLDPTANTHVFSNSGNGQQNVGVNFLPVTLGGTGDWIKVSFDYRYSAAPTNPGIQPFNFFRYGLYSNLGTPTTYDDDTGYLADVSYWDNTNATKDGDWNIRQEANWYPAFSNGILLDNESSTNPGPPVFPANGDIVSLVIPPVTKTFDDGTTPHSTSLLITRNGFNVDLQLYQDGVLRATATDSASAFMNFDTLYFESPSDSTGFAVDNILIEASSVPEPSRAALVLVGICGVMLRRRR